MATRFYDEALVKKLQYWTQSANLKIYSPSETKRLFEVIADTNDDSPIQLPIICVRRSGGYTIKNTGRQPISYAGRTISKSDTQVMTQNAIPIELQYQIDVYTRYYTEADEIVRNLVFNIINFPQLNMVIPYMNQDLPHQSTLHLADTVDDNSDVPERFVQGNFTRLTLNVTVPDAYLWDIRVKDTASISGIDVLAKDDEDNQGDGKGIVIRDIQTNL